MLCQSLNAEFAPKGTHVACIIVDAAVDAPDTLGKMLGAECFRHLRESRDMEHDGLLARQSRRDLLPYRSAASLRLDP